MTDRRTGKQAAVAARRNPLPSRLFLTPCVKAGMPWSAYQG